MSYQTRHIVRSIIFAVLGITLFGIILLLLQLDSPPLLQPPTTNGATINSTSPAPSSAPTEVPLIVPEVVPFPPKDTLAPDADGATIRLDTNAPAISIDRRMLGTNVPAWLTASRLENSTFQARTRAAGLTVMRIPGGSWSNAYDWLGCETRNSATCYWTWAARPSDFIGFMRNTNTEGMYIVNLNGTAKEAAAAVAFFNGTVDDERPIGVDVRGRDWYTVGHWARLRRDQGYPEPFKITLWEVGNEIYGGKSGMGKDCMPWGWEDVWTCDGTEYVEGIGSGRDRREGYREFRNTMRAVDPTIMVGAVGVAEQSSWNNWGNEVIAAAGNEMDFYSIHHYGYDTPPVNPAEVLRKPQQTWQAMMNNVRTAFDRHAGGRQVPIALTEYNLVSFYDNDTAQLMIRAVNALYLADTLGQMKYHGVTLANQWNLANGRSGDKTDYGLVDHDSYQPYPTYYVYPLWARFGERMLPVTTTFDAETTLSVYGGRIDDTTLSLLAINKTGEPITPRIEIEGIRTVQSGLVDILSAPALDSLTVTFNDVSTPNADLSNAPSLVLNDPKHPLSYTFAPYSITLLRLNVSVDTSQIDPPVPGSNRVYLPLIIG